MKKRRLKEVLYGSEVRLMGIIANGIVHSTPKAVIFRNMKKEIWHTTKYLVLTEAEMQLMWSESTVMYNRVSKETFRDMRVSERKFGKKEDYEQYLAFRKEKLYDSVHKNWEILEKNKNSLADTVEYRVKLAEKQSILASKSVFYVCNWFKDCAKDHVPYQGKVYVHDNWEEFADDQDVDHIRAYIKNHRIMKVNEVVNNAPWLTTRRNCRHKLYPISVEEVLGSSVRRILKTHDLRGVHENEYNMVLTPSKVAYIGYYERLKGLSYLKKLFDTPKLDKDIKNTKILVAKWRDRSREE